MGIHFLATIKDPAVLLPVILFLFLLGVFGLFVVYSSVILARKAWRPLNVYLFIVAVMAFLYMLGVGIYLVKTRQIKSRSLLKFLMFLLGS
jgi:hypothetical protein